MPMIDFLQNIVEWLENIGTVIIDYFKNTFSALSMCYDAVSMCYRPLSLFAPIAPIVAMATSILAVAIIYKILGSR